MPEDIFNKEDLLNQYNEFYAQEMLKAESERQAFNDKESPNVFLGGMLSSIDKGALGDSSETNQDVFFNTIHLNALFAVIEQNNLRLLKIIEDSKQRQG